MNDYLACPRKFFYTKVLGIDVEEANWDAPNFGTLIHSLLEYSINFAKENNLYPKIDEILERFRSGMNSTRFTSEARKEKYFKQGQEIILKYYPYFSQIPVSRVADVEFSFYGVDVDGDLITGKIDRIEKNSDGTYELYDYKTGHYTSEKKVAPDEEKQNYFNQLCFYKYAFEKLTGNKVSKVGIIYVENHEKSVDKYLTDEDMVYIENLIKETYEKIKLLKFNPIKEDKQGVCKTCVYKHLCKLDLI